MNYFKLGLTIYLAMMAHYATTTALDNWQLHIAANKAKEALARSAEKFKRETIKQQLANERELKRLTEQNKAFTAKQAELNEKRRREIADQKVNQEQRLRTCNFWISEYRKTGKILDKMHRDKLCKDANYRIN